MRTLAIVVLAVISGSALAISYLMYRQLDTGTVTLEASPELEMNEEGALCGEVDLVVEARSLGRWLLPLEDGQSVAGVITVQGDESSDIGLRIWSPTNRVVLFEPKRTHHQEFQVDATIRGDYRFEFDNRHSTFTGKRVKVSLCLT